MRQPRLCRQCSKEFLPNSANQQWCSLICRVGKAPEYRHCLFCKKPFVLKTRRQVYCSTLCKKGIAALSKPFSHGTGVLQQSSPVVLLPKQSFKSLYHKDRELFAQRMPYTLNGITWWGTPCCYCGDPAEADDHVLPISAFRKLLAAGNVTIPDDLLRIVPSCHECNSLLGDKIFRSFEEKRLYAKGAIARRYHSALEYPYWEPEELTQLLGNLHAWIASGQEARELIFERLRF